MRVYRSHPRKDFALLASNRIHNRMKLTWFEVDIIKISFTLKVKAACKYVYTSEKGQPPTTSQPTLIHGDDDKHAEPRAASRPVFWSHQITT